MRALPAPREKTLAGFLRVMTVSANGATWGIAAIAIFAGVEFEWIPTDLRGAAAGTLTAMIAPMVAWVIVKAFKIHYRRRRPFQRLDGFIQHTPAPLNDSFPSGHTASVFAFAVAMLAFGPVVSGWVTLWAAAVAYSRYYLGVHFPSDIFVGALIGILAGSSVLTVRSAHGADKYPSYTEMAKHEHEGIDFFVDLAEPRSKILVLAIHGQYLEPGSDDVAEAIAGSDFRKYIFRANKNVNWADLHVTSTHFDDPRALDLAKASDLCVSVHGYKEPKKQSICLGGGNVSARSDVLKAISAVFPEIEFDSNCQEIGGRDPANIVNRCSRQGLQLELSK
jgi:phage replication-related protein YjqB (UPF0714/DUF867 family)/membrane-associated phospholipid phosphatase